MSELPDSAIEAAAEARWLSYRAAMKIDSNATWGTLNRLSKDQWLRDTRAAIEAAMPAIREHIAQEIEAAVKTSGRFGEWIDGAYAASGLVREGTNR